MYTGCTDLSSTLYSVLHSTGAIWFSDLSFQSLQHARQLHVSAEKTPRHLWLLLSEQCSTSASGYWE